MKIPSVCSSAAELISKVRPGDRIFLHGAAATPVELAGAIANDASRLKNAEVIHLHTHGPAAYANRLELKTMSLFVGPNLRHQMNGKNVDYIPCCLSEIPTIFRRRIRPLDVAIVQVSPPDKNGFCSLGTSIDIAKSAVDSATLILAHINSNMPRTMGDSLIPYSKFDAVWEHSRPLIGTIPRVPSLEEARVAEVVAQLVDNGACLQLGIGGIPDSVLTFLKTRRNLGVHTEMFSDGMVDLFEAGAIDNSQKSFYKGKIVTSFVNGTQRVFDFVHDNPGVLFIESDYVNRAEVIARNKNVVGINSAIEIDLTGQVVSDSIGTDIVSGVGGQMDFMRGAAMSEGGKAILAITSRTSRGQPRIVEKIRDGAGVVTPRAHVHYIVTEYGIADLYGKSLGERADALTQIAHPDDRERLKSALESRYNFTPRN